MIGADTAVFLNGLFMPGHLDRYPTQGAYCWFPGDIAHIRFLDELRPSDNLLLLPYGHTELRVTVAIPSLILPRKIAHIRGSTLSDLSLLPGFCKSASEDLKVCDAKSRLL